MTIKSKRYPLEIWERAVRMVLEHQDEYRSQWAAAARIKHLFDPYESTL